MANPPKVFAFPLILACGVVNPKNIQIQVEDIIVNKDKIYEALQPERFKSYLKSAFSDAGIASIELLKDKDKVERAANIAYNKMPVLPYRAIIKVVLGKEGFVKLVLKICDKMLEAKSMDISWLNLDYLKSTLPNVKN